VGLRRDVSRGVFWVAVSQAGNKAIAFIVQIILARILLPEDFGLVAIAYLALDSLQLFSEFGFTSALIYRKGRIKEASWNAFYLVLLGGLLTTVVGIVAAPTIAWFFKDPRVTPLLRVLSATMLLSAFGQVPLTLLAREMDFKKRLIPMVVPSMGNGIVSVICALSGLGVWSLVAGRITHSLLTSILAYAVTDWRPKWELDRNLIREMFEYGKHIVGSQLLVFGITNVDDTFVGRILDTSALGAYGLAYTFSNLPATQITRIVGQVMFPAFSRIQDDAVAMKRIFLETMEYIALLSIPISVGTIVFAGDFVYNVYGEKWAAAIVPLQWLGIYGLIRSIAANMGNIFKASGMTKWLTYIALWRLITMLLFLYPATKYYGIVGVSVLSAVVAVVDFFISAILVNRIIHARATDYIRVLGPILLISVGAAAVARLAQEQFRATPHARIAFITALLVMMIIYFAGIWIVNRGLRHKIQGILRTVSEKNGFRYLGEDDLTG
jgi:O-antigen/teichoic acid export membrane protein